MSVPIANIRRLDGPDPVHGAVTMARTFCAAHGLTAESAARLAILVEELVMNLFDHGGADLGADGTDCVELGLLREAGVVRMLLLDRCAPFDPRGSLVGDDLAIPDRGGGAGLALLRAWAETIDYRSEGGVNWLDVRLRDR